VGKVEDVDKAVETLLQNLSAQLKNAVTQQDLDAVSAIADQIDKDATDLAAAVTANTPQGPPAQAPKKYSTGHKKK
jgi:acyl-CoA reductase-like NAD-dependent aldehyde dehydrogenase